MSLPGQAESYWIATTPRTDYPPLMGDLTVDVAIIGGGIVGITAASILKEGGATVAVIESHRILEGVTGHTTAKVTSQHGIKYRDLVERVGRERAQIYGAANQAAIEMIATTAARKQIDCDFRRISACTYTDSPEQVQKIQSEAVTSQSLGLPVYYEQQAPVPFPTLAAVCFRDQALFHPRKYLLALAREVPGGGSHVLESTRALDVEEGKPHTVRTDRGIVRADHVVVATHYPILDRGLYFVRLRPWRSYVMSIRIGGDVPDGLFITPKPGYHSLRPHPTDDGWVLLVGGQEHLTGHGGDTVERYRKVEEWARSHFDVLSVDYRWSTQDNTSLDGLPYAGRYAPTSPRVHVATGFAGWGMTNGTAAAAIVADAIMGRQNDWEPAYSPARLDQLTAVGRFVKGGLTFAEHFAGRRLASAPQESPAAIARGEGRIIEVQGKKVAFYADEQGELHAMSPYCAHQRCVLNWNPAEKTWDCPCHGSRFAATGEAIHGPTVRDLEKVRIEQVE